VPRPLPTTSVDPPEFLQLAGHPLRWRLLGELTRSDRTVQELTAAVGEAQNLVSYHLRKLREAGLVSSRRSSFDGRDAYYAVDLTRFGALLSEAATTLHPGLAAAGPTASTSSLPEPGPSERPGPRKKRVGGAPTARVLFLCTGNSARSPIAEAIVRSRSGGAVEVHSGGSHPKPMHPNAVRVLRDELGVDPADHVPKHLDVFTGQRFDWVISLCDKVREVCPEFPGEPRTVHWSIPDPSAVTGARESWAAFRDLAAELETRATFLLAYIANPTT
jgi:protein-tyrosine-phosphatase/DNA-binding transcriptional ArsR family regulator